MTGYGIAEVVKEEFHRHFTFGQKFSMESFSVYGAFLRTAPGHKERLNEEIFEFAYKQFTLYIQAHPERRGNDSGNENDYLGKEYARNLAAFFLGGEEKISLYPSDGPAVIPEEHQRGALYSELTQVEEKVLDIDSKDQVTKKVLETRLCRILSAKLEGLDTQDLIGRIYDRLDEGIIRQANKEAEVERLSTI